VQFSAAITVIFY